MSVAETIRASVPAHRHAVTSASAAVKTQTVSIPWTIWSAVGGIGLTLIGAILDFAWHMSIGRDQFWTGPHIVIGSGAGMLMLAVCVYEIVATTGAGIGPSRAAHVELRSLRLRAPGGVFIALWGSVAMLASTPFDNWWHDAYGLDLAFITPPHALLSLGYFTTKIGAMVWLASVMNRSTDVVRQRLVWLFLLVAAICLVFSPAARFTGRIGMHTAACYLAVGLGIPGMLIGAARGSGRTWGCTIVSAAYMSIVIAAVWVLPLFPAQPKLGPVYHNVTHLIPPQFPLLLVVPAVVADLLLRRLGRWSDWLTAACVGPLFVLSFLAVQWPFADLLMSPVSRNWIFGTAYFAYSDPAGILFDPYVFKPAEPPGVFVLLLLAALAASTVTTRLGLAWGDWMRRVRR